MIDPLRAEPIVFVDYENTSFHGLEGIGEIDPGVVVVILYNRVSSAMKLEMLERISTAECKVRFWAADVECGKNALDFQLAVMLERAVYQDRPKIAVVSKDHGYRAAAAAIKRIHKREIELVESLAALGSEWKSHPGSGQGAGNGVSNAVQRTGQPSPQQWAQLNNAVCKAVRGTAAKGETAEVFEALRETSDRRSFSERLASALTPSRVALHAAAYGSYQNALAAV